MLSFLGRAMAVVSLHSSSTLAKTVHVPVAARAHQDALNLERQEVETLTLVLSIKFMSSAIAMCVLNC